MSASRDLRDVAVRVPFFRHFLILTVLESTALHRFPLRHMRRDPDTILTDVALQIMAF